MSAADFGWKWIFPRLFNPSGVKSWDCFIPAPQKFGPALKSSPPLADALAASKLGRSHRFPLFLRFILRFFCTAYTSKASQSSPPLAGSQLPASLVGSSEDNFLDAVASLVRFSKWRENLHKVVWGTWLTIASPAPSPVGPSAKLFIVWTLDREENSFS